MRGIIAAALCAALFASSVALAEEAPCPKGEAGAGYPWQKNVLMKGDHYAVVIVDVDRTGRAIRCGIGDNDISDPETRFRLCMAYKDDWHTAPAATEDPDIRTIKRRTTMIGYEHEMADQKARKAWFKQHPDERQECYPD
jgi:hypothetical protein